MRLLLLRHGKAATPSLIDDFDRPLTDEGREAAANIGAYIRERRLLPKVVICSTACRTRQTLSVALGDSPTDYEIINDPELYLAPTAMLLGKVSGQRASPLMLIGHNPGLHELGALLVSKKQKPEVQREASEFLRKFPPAGLVAIDFAIESWSGLSPGSGKLEFFVPPKLLKPTERKG